jgi:hypothetical protein
MADPNRKFASDADHNGGSPEASTPQAVTASDSSAADIGAAFPEAATETIAALLHLIRLMGGEIVLNAAGGETERFERAVRTKIEQFQSPTTNQAARKSGLAFASHLVEQVLTQLRAQAEVKRSLTKGQQSQRQQPHPDAAADATLPKFLN